MSGANLQSIQALEEFANSMQFISTTAISEIESMMQSVGGTVHEAEANLDLLYGKLRAAEEDYCNEDEDRGGDYNAVKAAQQNVANAQAYLEKVKTAASSFSKALDASRARLESLILSAGEFLSKRIDTAKSYLAFSVNGEATGLIVSARGVSSTGIVAGANSHGLEVAPKSAIAPIATSLSSAQARDLPPLPGEFEWIPVDDIEWTEIPSDLDYKKVPRDKIETMLSAFENDLLPVISEKPRVTRTELGELDKSLGRTESSGCVRSDSLSLCYDCMFRSDVIVLDVEPGNTGSKLGITSGRHRLLVTKELGWKFIPARVLGRSKQ